MTLVLVTLLAACAPKPAEIKISGEPQVKVFELKDVPLPNAQVLDKDKKPIQNAPAIAWTVEPATIAKLSADGKKITPLADGDATVKAKVGTVEASYKLTVSLPDAVEIAGLPAGKVLGLGETINLTAKVMADGAEVPNMKVTWASGDEKIATVAAGKVTGVAKGETAIKATFEKLTGEIKVAVSDVPAAPADPKADAKAAPAPAPTTKAAVPAPAPAGAPKKVPTPGKAATPAKK